MAKENKSTSNLTLWQEFYKTAAQFRGLAPWKWFHDTDIFGVEHPETGEIGWCCIMGRAGQHYALAVYRGQAGWMSYSNMSKTGNHQNPLNPESFNAVLSQDCLMVSFENADNVPKESKKHLTSLDIKFRGAGQWIVPQTFDMGYHSWLPEEKELPFFIQCIQQAMNVAFRAEDNPNLLAPNTNLWLVRSPQKQVDGSLIWDDKSIDVNDVYGQREIKMLVPTEPFIKKAKALPKLKSGVSIISYLMPNRVQERPSSRPWHPFLMAAISEKNGMIIAQEMCPLADLPFVLEGFLLNTFKAMRGRPSNINIHYQPLGDALVLISQHLDIKLQQLDGDEEFIADFMELMSMMRG